MKKLLIGLTVLLTSLSAYTYHSNIQFTDRLSIEMCNYEAQKGYPLSSCVYSPEFLQIKHYKTALDRALKTLLATVGVDKTKVMISYPIYGPEDNQLFVDFEINHLNKKCVGSISYSFARNIYDNSRYLKPVIFKNVKIRNRMSGHGSIKCEDKERINIEFDNKGFKTLE